ncbi:PAT family beta-lactamase induction signal transducer AmpG [Sphaerotilus sulfidivorans]|uniref:MFS transporter n=1 Tax=Sphaerotilus sulfidivorans TaxID=639200 RepID=A0A5C1Q598_9BURK|nr:MFS transporter [Sphaerotilus sulfidivorans]QEN02059.1 MFS transporter [Sphaerotilus sulfidivorans]
MTASAPTPNPPLLPVLAPAGPGWRLWRLAAVLMLGFASGLPLALTGQAMQAWLSLEGIDVATIGFLSLVGLPYTFKFLWAPLMDRFDPPWLGRRRGWLVLTQLLLAGALLLMAGTSPKESMRLYALLAVAIAFLSASQDVVIDAYRTDLLPAPERGLGASLSVLGYRLAMILSGGIALIWTDPVNAGGPAGWTWPEVYRLMALLMVAAAGVSALLLPRLPRLERPESVARNDLIGFAAVLAAAAVGYLLTDRVLGPLSSTLLGPLLEQTTLAPTLRQRWADLLALLAGIAITLPLGAWAARVARFETLLGGMASYFAQPGAWAFLGFIVLYKLGDAFAGSLMTPFLLKAMAFGSAEVGVVNKVIGLWLTIGGALLGGALMLRLGLWRSLMLFGVLQMASNLGFWWLAVHGQGALPGLTVPAFDWGFLKLAQATPVDGGLLMVIAFENISGGMGTAAFVAFLMSLTSQRFTATQYAMLSAFASIGRVWVGPLAGVLAESIGWPSFFLVSTLAALPALWMLMRLRPTVQALEIAPGAAAADD